MTAPTTKDLVDPERVYLTGFSLGCMMAQRFALERSKLVAGFMCYGGELSLSSFADGNTAVERFDLQPMPMYAIIGDNDPWFNLMNDDFRSWVSWNGCSETTQTTIDLPSTEWLSAT